MTTRGALALTMIPVMLLFMATGAPFFAAMGGVGIFYGLSFYGWSALATSCIRAFSFMTRPEFVAIPMFVLMGSFLGGSGVAEMLFDGIYKLFGPVRGGLCIAVCAICTLLAACTGVAAGPVATMALVALPVMLKRKYDIGFATSVISASGTLGTIIPPSSMLIMYSIYTEMSVGKLYYAAYLPGLLLSGLFVAFILLTSYFMPWMAPSALPEDRGVNIWASLKVFFVGVVPVLFLIFAVVGTLFLGIATPTEAAGVGALGALLMSIVYKKMSWAKLSRCLTTSYRAASMIGAMMIGANFFTAVFLGSGGGNFIGAYLKSLGLGAGATIFIVLALDFVLGFAMSNMVILLIIIPIFTPVLRQYGIDELWFAMLFTMMGQVAYLTPPMAPGVYLLKPLAPKEIMLTDMYKGIIPYIIMDTVGAFMVYFFPQIALWLPNLMVKKFT
ncbi:MAG: TRAP transporter large permease subunit [Chloroflexota bacterium]